MARKLTEADKKNKNARTVMVQKRKARKTLNKAADAADTTAKRKKGAAKFFGGTPDNKKRSSGTSLLARGARKTAIKKSGEAVKSQLKAKRLRGAAKKIK